MFFLYDSIFKMLSKLRLQLSDNSCISYKIWSLYIDHLNLKVKWYLMNDTSLFFNFLNFVQNFFFCFSNMTNGIWHSSPFIAKLCKSPCVSLFFYIILRPFNFDHFLDKPFISLQWPFTENSKVAYCKEYLIWAFSLL